MDHCGNTVTAGSGLAGGLHRALAAVAGRGPVVKHFAGQRKIQIGVIGIHIGLDKRDIIQINDTAALIDLEAQLYLLFRVSVVVAYTLGDAYRTGDFHPAIGNIVQGLCRVIHPPAALIVAVVHIGGKFQSVGLIYPHPIGQKVDIARLHCKVSGIEIAVTCCVHCDGIALVGNFALNECIVVGIEGIHTPTVYRLGVGIVTVKGAVIQHTILGGLAVAHILYLAQTNQGDIVQIDDCLAVTSTVRILTGQLCPAGLGMNGLKAHKALRALRQLRCSKPDLHLLPLTVCIGRNPTGEEILPAAAGAGEEIGDKFQILGVFYFYIVGKLVFAGALHYHLIALQVAAGLGNKPHHAAVFIGGTEGRNALFGTPALNLTAVEGAVGDDVIGAGGIFRAAVVIRRIQQYRLVGLLLRNGEVIPQTGAGIVGIHKVDSDRLGTGGGNKFKGYRFPAVCLIAGCAVLGIAGSLAAGELLNVDNGAVGCQAFRVIGNNVHLIGNGINIVGLYGYLLAIGINLPAIAQGGFHILAVGIGLDAVAAGALGQEVPLLVSLLKIAVGRHTGIRHDRRDLLFLDGHPVPLHRAALILTFVGLQMELYLCCIGAGGIFCYEIHPTGRAGIIELYKRLGAQLFSGSIKLPNPVDRLCAAVYLNTGGHFVGLAGYYGIVQKTFGIAVTVGRLSQHSVCDRCATPQIPGQCLLCVELHIQCKIGGDCGGGLCSLRFGGFRLGGLRLSCFRLGCFRLGCFRLGGLFLLQLHFHIVPLDAAALILTLVGLNMELYRANICVGGIFIGKIYPIVRAVCEEPGDRQIPNLAACGVIFIQPIDRLAAACGFDFCRDNVGLSGCYRVLLRTLGIAVTVGRLGQDAVFYL